MKREVLFLVAVLSVFVMFSTSDAHATWYYACTVESIGTAGGGMMVQLGNTSFTGGKQWFKTNTANTTEQNRIMAAILTALSLEKTVDIAVNTPFPALPDYPVILNLYLKK